jgi:hypothetical protein
MIQPIITIKTRCNYINTFFKNIYLDFDLDKEKSGLWYLIINSKDGTELFRIPLNFTELNTITHFIYIMFKYESEMKK